MWYTRLNGLVYAAASPWVRTSTEPRINSVPDVTCNMPKDTGVYIYRLGTELL